MCARRRTYFLFAQKESRQRKSAPQSASLRFAAGNLRCSVLGGAAELTAFGLWPNSVQTAAASQITKCVCPSAHAPTPGPALLGAARRGGSGDRDGCCFAAAPGVGDARGARCRRAVQPPWRAERSEGPQAERSKGPCGARSHPLLTVPRSAEAGVARVPKDTRASSSDSPQMFERSSKNAASSEAHPSFEHRRLPPRPPGEGDTGSGVVFSWPTFF